MSRTTQAPEPTNTAPISMTSAPTLDSGDAGSAEPFIAFVAFVVLNGPGTGWPKSSGGRATSTTPAIAHALARTSTSLSFSPRTRRAISAAQTGEVMKIDVASPRGMIPKE
eukprot:scaffold27036_cov63-Phaeocystis_antarctica.AAC.4